MKWIKITTSKKGNKRAYYFCHSNQRLMPMKLAEAEYLLASEQAEKFDLY